MVSWVSDAICQILTIQNDRTVHLIPLLKGWPRSTNGQSRYQHGLPVAKGEEIGRRSLMLSGYNQRFVLNSVALTSSLTDLTWKIGLNLVQWTDWWQVTYERLKQALWKLSGHERHYSVEKQCLVSSSRYYVLGCPFIVCSDHAML